MTIRANRAWIPVPGLGEWVVDRHDGVSFGPCLVIGSSSGSWFSPISYERVELLCQILWGSGYQGTRLYETLTTTAAYLRQGDTLSAKLCLRRLGLQPLSATQLRRLDIFASILENGLTDRQLTAACQSLMGRHFNGPHGHIEDAITKLHQMDAGQMTKKCAAHFREAMETAKFSMKGHPILAKDYADFLSNNPLFEEVSPDQINQAVDPDKYDRKVGDILVFPAAPGHDEGHIQMWDGTKWFSTTGQPSGWPHRNYKLISGPPYFRVFRAR